MKTFAYIVIKDSDVRNKFFFDHMNRDSKNIFYNRFSNSKFFTLCFTENGQKMEILPTSLINMGRHISFKKCHLDELSLIPSEAICSYLSTFIRK
ncbi:hypothetical protein VBApiPXC38_75 [Acinetobacter phage VB_ApiP_XC38]|uniref:Uncharacterized protein n=1 Tax=Acinetobacter phage VB_ApiP_XC38 TaxID=2655002 RepID=A0A5P8PR57_9CAUD|nr:hypothetical protein KNU81_gp75 [Acinetobacter phage VB_ApiP_XC38]QFR59762.1 hypothetical protein VBApiPXC38_75 [Acinetobacter phage VB_ApiP_XC38]